MLLIALLADIAVIWMEAMAVRACWRDSGVRMFRFYTQDSNILALAVCAVCAVCTAFCLATGRPLPLWTARLKHMAAVCLMVTFIIATCVLVPMEPQNSFRSFMLEGPMLYMHTLCPLVMLASYLLLQRGVPFAWYNAFVPVIPTVIYGLVSIAMNLKRVYSGPYPFLRIHEQPPAVTVAWCIAIVAGTFVLALAMGKLCVQPFGHGSN